MEYPNGMVLYSGVSSEMPPWASTTVGDCVCESIWVDNPGDIKQHKQVHNLRVALHAQGAGNYWGKFGTGVRACILKPTPIIYMAFEKNPAHSYT